MNPTCRAEGSLLGISAISSHLQELNYPEKSIKSMLKCGTETGVTIFAQCDCQVVPVKLKHRCNLRTCPYCAKTRKRRIRRKFLPYLKKQYQDRENFLYFLTISPKNYENLNYGLKHIKQSFSKFLRHKYIRDRVKGGLYVIETKGFDGNWNVHIHAIIYGRFLDNRIRGHCSDCGQNLIKFDYVKQKYYCASHKCGSFDVVFEKNSRLVSLFKQSSGMDCNVHISKQGSAGFTLNYMLKYVSSNKDDFATDRDVAIYISSTRKQKLINSFGLFFNAKIEKQKYCCPLCSSQISFIVDFQVMNIFNGSGDPPPYDLDYFIKSGEKNSP